MKKSIIIIGAGVSGLMAARELSPLYTVTILEAQQRIGGRIVTLRRADDILEFGAEFIHGRLPLTFRLLKKAGIEVTPVKGKSYENKNGRFIDEKPSSAQWGRLLRKMASVKQDLTLYRFLEDNYGSDNDQLFRETVIAFASGFDLADIKQVSVKSLYREWKEDKNENFRVNAGYISLINYLAKEAACEIIVKKKATHIDWSKANVKVYTDDGEMFQADKLLITVPVTLMTEKTVATSISFNPPVNEYFDAASQIGFGAVLKLIIKFKKGFWQKNAGFMYSDQEYFPTWWTQSPSDVPILTGWFGGPKAATLSFESNDAIVLKALESLSNIFKRDVHQIREDIIYTEICNWQKEVFAKGGYSYEKLYSGTAKKILNTALANTIFFAGEAIYSGRHPGTVEAALVSGKKAARLISQSF